MSKSYRRDQKSESVNMSGLPGASVPTYGEFYCEFFVPNILYEGRGVRELERERVPPRGLRSLRHGGQIGGGRQALAAYALDFD